MQRLYLLHVVKWRRKRGEKTQWHYQVADAANKIPWCFLASPPMTSVNCFVCRSGIRTYWTTLCICSPSRIISKRVKKLLHDYQCPSALYLNLKIKSSGFDVHLSLKYHKGNGTSASLACVKQNRRCTFVDSNGPIQFLGSHNTQIDGLRFTTPFSLFLLPGKVNLLSSLTGSSLTWTVPHGEQHLAF